MTHTFVARSRPLLAVLLSLLAACGKDDVTAVTTTPVATSVAAAGGDTQTITAGAAASTPLAVKVLDASGAPMSGVAVTWAIASGGGTLSATSATTDATGVASVTYTAGLAAGTATITATAGSLTAVTFTETIAAPPTTSTIVDYTQTGGDIATTFQTYAATAVDESPVSVSGAGTLTLTAPVVTKTAGDASSEATSDEFGVNAGVLAAGTSRVNVVGGSVTTSASGASGLFATGSGTMIALTSGAAVTTGGRASSGVAATFGGVDSLVDAVVTTTGAASPGLDAGDVGTIALTRGAVTTSADDSPAIRASGAVSVVQATLVATGGAGAVVEDGGSVTLDGSRLTARTVGVVLEGGGTATLAGGSLASGGELLRVAGTRGTITLKENATVASATGVLLRADSAADATLAADGELLTGDVLADSTSAATVTLAHGTILRGAVQRAAVALDSTSAWSVTAPSAVTRLQGATIVGDAITNVLGNGFAVTYDAALAENAILAGKTYTLANGGTLAPR